MLPPHLGATMRSTGEIHLHALGAGSVRDSDGDGNAIRVTVNAPAKPNEPHFGTPFCTVSKSQPKTAPHPTAMAPV